jgi:hypothetical protein
VKHFIPNIVFPEVWFSRQMKASKNARNQTFLELFNEEYVSFGAYKDIKKKKKYPYTMHIFPNLFPPSLPQKMNGKGKAIPVTGCGGP